MRERPHLLFERLESRQLFAVAVGTNINGLAFADTPGYPPPNTQIAVGPNQVLQLVNNGIAVYNKSGVLLGKATLSDALASLSPGAILINPQVTYDDLAGRFVVAVLDIDPAAQNSQLDLLVSRSSDLTQGFGEVHQIDLDESIDFRGIRFFANSPKMGWNYDTYTFTFRMTAYPGQDIGGDLDSPEIVSIDKASVLDNNPATVTVFRRFDPTAYPGGNRGADAFLLNAQPVTMHSAHAGDPMQFVVNFVEGHQDQGFPFPPPPTFRLREVQLYSAANLLSDNPVFAFLGSQNIDSDLGGDPALPPAIQPGGTFLKVGDTRIANAVSRDGHLVFALNVDDGSGGGGPAVAWSDWDLSSLGSETGLVFQTGIINPSDAYAFAPAIDIAPNGDVGMTYLEAGQREYLSTYFTGRKASDPVNTMQTPRLIKAGEAVYQSIFDLSPHLITVNGNQQISLDPPLGYLVGQYGSMAVDPVNGSFWAANEYATSKFNPVQSLANWGTWIGNFAITSNGAAARVASLTISQPVIPRRSAVRTLTSDLRNLLA